MEKPQQMIRFPAVRVADQKLVRQGRKGSWELYDLKSDRTEMHNLADNQPERVKELAARWEAWAKRAQVIPYGDTAGNRPRQQAQEK